MSNITLTMKTSALLAELDRCIKWVDKRTINESLQGFLFEIHDGFLSISASDGLSTDITTRIAVDVDGPVKKCIPAFPLLGFVSEVSKVSEDIGITFGKKIALSAGKHKTNIVPFNESMFPDLFRDNDNVGTQIDPDVFSRAVKLTVGVSDAKSPFPTLGGIYFADNNAVSTDGVRMCYLGDVDISEDPILLDGIVCGKIAQAIIGQDNVFIAADAGRIMFYWDGGVISVTRMFGNFPKYQALIRETSETTISVDKNQLAIATRMCSSYAQQSGNLVTFEATEGKLIMQAVSMTGSHKSVLDCGMFDGPEKKIGLSVKYLLDAAMKVDSQDIVIGINSDKDIVLFTNDNDYIYGIMPMYVS